MNVSERTEEAIKNGQSKENGNIGYTRQNTKINVREHRRGNQEWAISLKKMGTLDTQDRRRK